MELRSHARGALRGAVSFAALLLASALVALWAWNTLAELFGGQEAQLRHALALILALAVLALPLHPRRGRRKPS